MKKITTILAVVLLMSVNLYATNLYVNATTGIDTNDGLTESTPFLTIAKAITMAADADVINIAAGTYTEFLLNPGDKSLSFIGAGSGTTIIQGNTTSSATTNSGSVFSMITPITAPRSYTLQDLTIKWGFIGAGNGAGFNVNAGTAATLTLTMTRCAILNNRNNVSSGLGGGIFLGGNVSTTLTDCEIAFNTTKSGNTSGGGGGICIGAVGTTCPLVLNHCYVHDNTTTRAGGGGILFASSNTTTPVDITIKNSTFYNNTVGNLSSLGTERNKGAAICVIAGNSGTATVDHKLVIENSTIYGNKSITTDACGNGVFFSSNITLGATGNTQTVTINHSTIANNYSNAIGAAGTGADGVCISANGKYPTNLIMNNSIVMGNSGSTTNISQVGVNAASQANIVNSGITNSIFGIVSGGTWVDATNHNNLTATLADLAFYPTLTFDYFTPVLKISTGSIAKNYVINNQLTSITNDQLGYIRDAVSDAGAYEYSDLTTNNINPDSDFKIYLNNNRIFTNSLEGTLDVYSINGNLVLKTNLLNQPVSLTGIVKGIYLVKVNTKSGDQITKKIVVI